MWQIDTCLAWLACLRLALRTWSSCRKAHVEHVAPVLVVQLDTHFSVRARNHRPRECLRDLSHGQQMDASPLLSGGGRWRMKRRQRRWQRLLPSWQEQQLVWSSRELERSCDPVANVPGSEHAFSKGGWKRVAA